MQNTQLNTYLRQLIKTFKNQHIFIQKELIEKINWIENSIKSYIPFHQNGRLTFLLKDCTCPTIPNLISPYSKINSSCPYHKKKGKSC